MQNVDKEGRHNKLEAETSSTELREQVAQDGPLQDTEPLLGSELSGRTSSFSSNTPKETESPSNRENAESFEVTVGVDESAVMRRVNFHILPIFFALAMLCSIDRANLSFAARQLNHDLHFSKTVYGFGSGIFFIGYAVMALPTPFICERIGAPLFLGIILIIWGCTATIFAFITSSWQFLILRFLLGIAESGAYPGMWYHLALFYTPMELGLAYTIVSTASSLSGAAGGPMASVLLRLDGFLGFRGWRWLFLLEGIPPIGLGLVMIFFLAKNPSEAFFLPPLERQWLVARQQPKSAQASEPSDSLKQGVLAPENKPPSATSSLMSMLQEWRIWWLSGTWMIVVLCVDCMIFWIPLIFGSMLYGEVVSDGIDGNEDDEAVKRQGINVALLSFIPFASAAIGMLVVATIAKRTGERHWGIILPLALGMCMLAILPAVGWAIAWLGVIILSFACAGIWGPHGPLLSWPAKILEGTAAAAGFALIKTLGSFASFSGNFAVGWLHDVTGSFTVPIYLTAGLMIIGMVLAYTFKDQDGNRAMSPIELLRGARRLKDSRSDPIEYSLSRGNSRGPRWSRMKTTQEPAYVPFEMPNIPAFGTEDLTASTVYDRN